MDDLSKRRELFFNNLVLLGLDKVSLGKKYGIAFHKDMFILPNKKGFEIVTHFLFSKLSAVTNEDYNIPWPLLDKEHDRTFQKTSYGHLLKFSQENLVKFPRIVPSLLSNFGSDRFYEVYLAFSSYVLSKTIRQNGNINLLLRPAVTQENFATCKQILQLSTILQIQKFRDTERCTYNSHLIWTKFSKKFEKCLQMVKHTLKTDEELLREYRKVISSLYSIVPGENLKLDQVIERSFECWKPMLKQRKALIYFFSVEKRFWNYLASEIGENVENEFLNGEDYNIFISNLSEECSKKLEEVGFSSSQIDGKLSVLRFIKLFMAYLTYIAESLKKNNLSELHKVCSVKDTLCVQDDLSSIEGLNKKLSKDIIPEREDNIRKLKLIIGYDDPKLIELSCNQFCAPLPILSFNPEAVKERSADFNTGLDQKFQLYHTESKFYQQECNDSVYEKNFTPDLSCTALNHDISRNGIVPHINLSTSNGESSETHSGKKNVPFSYFHSRSSKLNISDLDDIDLDSAPSASFKMRGSWLNEESINSMTLPDMSFDE